MKNIWFNHWFSTVYNIIKLIKDNNNELHFFVSNKNDDSPIKKICDKWIKEPYEDISDIEYLDFALDVCKKYEIDVFVPYRYYLIISKHKNKFNDIGTQVLIDEYNKISILNDKIKTYNDLKNKEWIKIPDYYIATSVDEFEKYYNVLLKRYSKICYKFTHDQGGKSYRLIDNTPLTYESLGKKHTTRIGIEQTLKMLSQESSFKEIMLMPFLPDEELSVDCLKTQNGMISIPRVKTNSKTESIEYREDIMETVEKLSIVYDLECPYNIQFKYFNGIPYFLEINTRMSGGIHLSSIASGVNIPEIAIYKLLNIDKEWKNNMEYKKITQILMPVVL